MKKNFLSWIVIGTLAVVPAAIGCGDDDGAGGGGGSGGGAGGGGGSVTCEPVDVSPACETCICGFCDDEWAGCEADPGCDEQVDCAQAAVAGECAGMEGTAQQTCVFGECPNLISNAPAVAYLSCLRDNDCAEACAAAGDGGI